MTQSICNHASVTFMNMFIHQVGRLTDKDSMYNRQKYQLLTHTSK